MTAGLTSRLDTDEIQFLFPGPCHINIRNHQGDGMKLTRKNMIGPWAGLPIAWKDNDTFDEKAYRRNVARACAAGVPGVYTGGTTGEFYALEFEEFQQVTKATIKECKQAGTPVMIGCTSTFTLGVIRRARFARDQGADAIQVALPFWMEVPDRDVVPFFKAVSAAVPGLPISVYETMRTKKAISVELHRAIHKEVPAVIMVKSNANTIGRTKQGCAALSKLYNVFVSEDAIAE
jgi:dihydrodipicolinate synthase/N-acetylneuraminate lyase